MKTRHALLASLATLLFALAAVAAVCAQATNITLTATPNAVALIPGEIVQTLVTADIAITTVQAITLSAFTNASVDIKIENPVRSQPPLRGDLAWTVTITRSSAGQPAGTVYFAASYLATEAGGMIVPGLVTTSVDVRERIPETIDKIVSASLQSAFDTILDQQSQQVYVVVSNLSSVPVTVTDIMAWPIPGVTPAVQDMSAAFPLAAQQSHPFTITLAAGNAVQSGKELLVVQVDVDWLQSGQYRSGSLVLTKQFQTGVFGESAILQATGIPSTMLLPGFLFLTTLVVLTRWTWKKELVGLDFKKPDFWLFAITLSLLAIVFYPVLTGPVLSLVLQRPMTARNYLQGYGFNDILLLWLGAVLLGIIVWAVASTVWRLRLLYIANRQRAQRAMLVPRQDDSPLSILHKMANNQKKWMDLPLVDYPKGNAAQTVYVLPSGFPEAGKIWVAPRIHLHWLKADNKLKDEFDVIKDNPTQFRTLIRRLEEWQNPADPAIELDWDRAGAHISQPKLVDENQTGEATGDDPLFEVV